MTWQWILSAVSLLTSESLVWFPEPTGTTWTHKEKHSQSQCHRARHLYSRPESSGAECWVTSLRATSHIVPITIHLFQEWSRMFFLVLLRWSASFCFVCLIFPDLISRTFLKWAWNKAGDVVLLLAEGRVKAPADTDPGKWKMIHRVRRRGSSPWNAAPGGDAVLCSCTRQFLGSSSSGGLCG